MTRWDIYDCHRCPSKKNLKNLKKLIKKLKIKTGSLDPVYIRGVKHAGGCEKYCSNKYNVLGQVHELLIRCLSDLKVPCWKST
jgi:hypothetical protein